MRAEERVKALVCNGPRNVVVKNVPDAAIEQPTDASLRVTSADVCGSDLHMYEGRTSVEKERCSAADIGIVIEVGKAVQRIEKGDRFVLPFNVSCGFCRDCERGHTGACLDESRSAGAANSYATWTSRWPGRTVRVPYADFDCLRLAEDAEEREDDYVLLSDIFPTGYRRRSCLVKPGGTVVSTALAQWACWHRTPRC